MDQFDQDQRILENEIRSLESIVNDLRNEKRGLLEELDNIHEALTDENSKNNELEKIVE